MACRSSWNQSIKRIVLPVRLIKYLDSQLDRRGGAPISKETESATGCTVIQYRLVGRFIE
jgi:hypothetical protein